MSTPITYAAFRAECADAHAGLVAAGASAAKGGLGKDLLELVKVRASQLNGCAFCLKLHLDLARAAGVADAKLDLVAAWRDTALFSPEERAALAWTERLTRLDGQPDAAERDAILGDLFSPGDLQRLTVAIAVINAWNRIAGPLHFAPPA